MHRGLDDRRGLAETPPPTFPARRFVDCSDETASGLAVIADGTFEYEVCDGGCELAVTLLRATGWLSRRRLPLRPDPAGPAVPVEGAQVQGLRRWRYGLAAPRRRLGGRPLSRRADAFLNPLEAAGGSTAARPTGPDQPTDRPCGSTAPRSRRWSRDGDGVVVRLFHPGSDPASATVGDETSTSAPGEIATVRVGRRPGAG